MIGTRERMAADAGDRWFVQNAPPQATAPFVDTARGPSVDSPFFANGQFNGDYQGYITSLTNGKPASSETLRSLAPQLQQAGITLEPANAAGASSKLRFPTGQVVRVGNYFDGGGTPSWGWVEQPRADSGGNLGGGTLLQPFGEDFSRPTFTPPPDFQAPTGDQVFEDPGFQFRLDQGRQALERSAAAKGTLLTTGTLKDLESFNQSAASQEYGNVYARKAGEYESKYGKAVDTFSRDYNQALGEYGIKKGNFYDNQDRPFNKLTTLAGFGSLPPQNYAGQYGTLQMTGANNQGNYLTQGANGQAAGLIGGSNAYTNAFGSLANLGQQYASLYGSWNQKPKQQFPAGGYPTSLQGFGSFY